MVARDHLDVAARAHDVGVDALGGRDGEPDEAREDHGDDEGHDRLVGVRARGEDELAPALGEVAADGPALDHDRRKAGDAAPHGARLGARHDEGGG